MYSFISTPTEITVILEGTPYSAAVTHHNYKELREIITKGVPFDREELIEKFSPLETLKRITTTSGSFECSDAGDVSLEVNGATIYLPSNLATYVMTLHTEQGDLNVLYKFCEKLSLHTDNSVYAELFGFMQENGFALNQDGNILAYKIVDCNFKDKYTHTFDNSPGSEVTMDRAAVVRDSNRTCSAGLHAASHSYLSHYGSTYQGTDKVVILEIDPRDVVSIPTDYNSAKMRCCKYKVLREVTKPEFLKDRIVHESDDWCDSEDDSDDYTDWE